MTKKAAGARKARTATKQTKPAQLIGDQGPEIATAAATFQAAAAGPAIVVTGPKGGRRRSGLHFGPEPTVLFPGDLLQDADDEASRLRSAEALHGILTDPQLRCAHRHEDGTDEPFEPEAIEALRQSIVDARAGVDNAAD